MRETIIRMIAHNTTTQIKDSLNRAIKLETMQNMHWQTDDEAIKVVAGCLVNRKEEDKLSE